MYNPKLGLNLSSFRLNQRFLDIFLLFLHALGIIIVNEEQGQEEADNRTTGTNVHNLEHKQKIISKIQQKNHIDLE